MALRGTEGRASTSPPAATGGRLDDFRFAGRLAPLLAFLGVGTAIYVWGTSSSLRILTQLWVAYSVAYVMLALLAKFKGANAAWYYVLPVALFGVAIGSLASTVIAVAPNWQELLESGSARGWAMGAAFSTFFVGLSLVGGEVRYREQLVAEARNQLLEARLQALTAQIEPHFLINTLANLRYLIRKNDHGAEEMLDHLADFLQGALERSRSSESNLGQEVQLVTSYLSIMQMRLGERLRFSTRIPDKLKSIPFPPLLLQTLVENAVTHGIGPRDGGGVIDVEVRHDGPCVVVSVTDNGVGFADDADFAPGHGLRNSRERLDSFYAGRASLELVRAAPAGVVATISIPSARAA